MLRLTTNTILIVCLFWIVASRILVPGANIQPDSPRYVAAGLNIYQHGILSGQSYQKDVVPHPGLYAGGVLTAVEIAVAAMLSEDTYRDLVCIAKGRFDENCGGSLWSLKAIYLAETFVFHLCALFVGWRFFGRNMVAAWGVVAVSLVFKDTYAYASSPLSEQGYLMLAGLFAAAWIYAFDHAEKMRCWLIAGIFGGLTVLVKPAWLLLPVGLTFISIFALVSGNLRKKQILLASVSFCAAFALAISPMFIRNLVVLDTISMSQQSYLVSSLSHRLAFNLMSWREWLIGWIYYLPVSGAQRLFGADALLPLGWDEKSYYQFGRDVLDKLANEGRSVLEARSYLLSEYVFAMPLKFIAVTLLLLWRGIFVGHVVAMLAVPCAFIMTVFTRNGVWRRWMFILLPFLFMASVNAALSVSLYRYNLGLVIPYCVGIVWVLIALLNNLLARFNHIGFLATAKTFLPAIR
ncbi:hypothetical protein [Thalassospira tepidiphila]|uniref:hypothetical protein n=1 Tax=Thalassospira tepidiphila TaxID=393657 RepID=UPI003AA81061